MDENFNAVGIQSAAAGYDAGLRSHMQRVYNYMAGGLALTGGLAWMVANTTLGGMIWGSPLRWLVVMAPLAFLIFMQIRMQKLSASALRTIFFAYSATMGLSLSILFLVYTNASIARAFFITAATFGTMSLWGYTTKKDLSGFGGFLMMGVIGLLIASVVNMFLASPMMYWVTSVVGVFVFTGLTAWDTQRIAQQYYMPAVGSGDMVGKGALMGALQLYLDFLNLFMIMLRLFGNSRD